MNSRTFNYWLEVVYRRRALVFAISGVVFGAVAIATLFWPPVYVSTAKILVQDNRAQLLISPDLNDQPQQRGQMYPVTEEDLNSERELITSLYLVRQAVEGVTLPAPKTHGPFGDLSGAFSVLAQIPGQSYRTLHGAPTMSPQDRWALDLVGHLGSDVVKRSDIIEVSFHSHDPMWSQQFLTLLINHYLDFHARISHDPQAEQFFQEQAKLLQDKLNKSEQALSQFELKTGISNFQAQQQAVITRLSDLQLQRNKSAADLASAHEQVSAFGGLLQTTPQRIGKETRSVQNMALTQLKPQVMQLKAERAELLSRYQENSLRIREIDAKLAAAQHILDNENHLEVTEQATDLNPVWVTMDQSLAQAKGSESAMGATVNKLDDEIAKTQAQLDYLVNNSADFDGLQREVLSDKQALDSYVRKTEEARAAGALNTNKILNVSVAQPPLRPLKPIFPIVWLNLLAGFVLAIALGVAAAEFEERRDPKIYSSFSVARETGLQVVGVLSSQG